MVTDVGNTSFAARMEAVVQHLWHCPFCGGKEAKPANVIVDDSGVNDFSEVFCVNCQARGPKAEDWEEAARLWDTRKHAPGEFAAEAIRLFLEYRDKHGCDEKTAAIRAGWEIFAGVEARI